MVTIWKTHRKKMGNYGKSWGFDVEENGNMWEIIVEK